MASQVILRMKIMGFFQEFLMILNKFQRSHEAEVCNSKIQTRKSKFKNSAVKLNCSEAEQAFNLVQVHFHGKHIMV